MEVSGRKHLTQEVADGILICHPCGEDGSELPAHGYCTDCQDYLCEVCYNTHLRPKPSRHHTLLDKSEMPREVKTANSLDECTEMCREHRGKTVEYYCKIHDQLGCGPCMTTKHRSCDDAVQYIPQVSMGTTDSKQCYATQDNLESMKGETIDIKEDIKLNTKAVAEVSNIAIHAVSTFRNEIKTFFNKLEKDILEQIEEVRTENIQRMTSVSETCGQLERNVDTLTSDINQKVRERKENQLFVTLKHAKNNISVYDGELKQARVKLKYDTFEFVPSEMAVNMMKTLSSLGEIVVTKQNSTEKVSKNQDLESVSDYLHTSHKSASKSNMVTSADANQVSTATTDSRTHQTTTLKYCCDYGVTSSSKVKYSQDIDSSTKKTESSSVQQRASSSALQQAYSSAQQQASSSAQQQASISAQQQASSSAQQASWSAQLQASSSAQQQASSSAQQQSSSSAQRASNSAQQQTSSSAQRASNSAQQQASSSAQLASSSALQQTSRSAQQQAPSQAQQQVFSSLQHQASSSAQQQAFSSAQQTSSSASSAQQQAFSSAQQTSSSASSASSARQRAYSSLQQQASISAQQASSSAQQQASTSAQQASSSAQRASNSAEQHASDLAQQQAYSSAQQHASVSAQQASSSAQQQTSSSAQQNASSSAQQQAFSSAQQQTACLAQQQAPSSAQQQASSLASSAQHQTSSSAQQASSSAQQPPISAQQQASSSAQQQVSSDEASQSSVA